MRKTKPKAGKMVSLRIPADLLADVEGEARQRRITRSAVMVERLRSEPRSSGSRKRPSTLDLIAKYVGCFEGPGDLSTNPKYMEGYGLDRQQLARYRAARRGSR